MNIIGTKTYVLPAAGLVYRWPETPDPVPLDAADEAAPPGVADRLTAPGMDDLAPQVQRLAPRGPAWNTDETAAPFGARVQHGVWRLIAAALTQVYATLTRSSLSAFPSNCDEDALVEWEQELGEPSPCLGLAPSLAQRRRAVRGALLHLEGANRVEFIKIARRIGYEIEVSEAEASEFGWNGFGESGFGHPDLPFYFFISIGGELLTWIEFNAVGFGEDGFGSFTVDDLLCIINRARHSHTRATFLLDGLVL